MTVEANEAGGKINLLDLDRKGLEAFFAQMGEKAFRASQLMQWIHQRGVTDFDKMSNLSKVMRERLKERAVVHIPETVVEQGAKDGTRKWLLRLDSGNSIEMVYIPEDDRGTLCISSQVGCALACSFCATAQQGFNRNLTTAEIIGQLFLAKKTLEENMGDTTKRVVTNVVMMGMGEPLLNFDNVVKAMNLMMDDFGYGLSKRRVTLSTAGVVPAIDRLKEECDVALAVSLHATTDALRDELVPINKKYPIKELMAACCRYLDRDGRRKITFEYVMLKGVNDQPEHARQLIKLMKGVPGKVNLIPFNPFPGSDYVCSSRNAIFRFRDLLQQGGVITMTRKTRGEDIDAACGQLAGKVKDRTKRTQHKIIPIRGKTA